eukprot:5355251-Alexandrium_andersonii.AAC.1
MCEVAPTGGRLKGIATSTSFEPWARMLASSDWARGKPTSFGQRLQQASAKPLCKAASPCGTARGGRRE